jgi:uncharacterized protein YidB (DUF937 family)
VGLLDSILGAALGGAIDQQQAPAPQQMPAGGVASSPVLTALLPVVLGMLMNRGGGAPAGGGLGEVLGGMLGGGTTRGGSGGGIGDILGGMLCGGSAGGALGGLLEQFQRAGYADQANSWVGTGQNLPISPDVIGQVFGGGALSRIARQAGISEAEASQGLSQILPEVVDRLTPNGSVPDLDQLSASVQDMMRRMGG